jgi:hypothetical protein
MPPLSRFRVTLFRPGEARLFALAWATGFLFFLVLLS